MTNAGQDPSAVTWSAADAAMASGRPALARSGRFHRRRGAVCAIGYCQQCEISTTSGRELACQVPAGAQQRSATLDPLRPLGLVAERWTPWFYERRFLRPAVLRGTYLEVLRRLSGAGRLSGRLGRQTTRVVREEHADVVAIGDATVPGARTVDPSRGEEPIGIYGGNVLAVLSPDAITAIHFDRMVLATGGHTVLPPVRGNDLPGVIGLAAAERYAARGALRPGLRLAVWAGEERRGRIDALVHEHGLRLVWCSGEAPSRIRGRGRVRSVDTRSGSVACDVFISGVEQPAIELARQAGVRATLSDEGFPILVLAGVPDWLELRGEAARVTSGVAAVEPQDEAFACACEDVRVGDLRACVADGFLSTELVKRRTGALTGPCQGKLCASVVFDVLDRAGAKGGPTRPRPLVAPISLRQLAADA